MASYDYFDGRASDGAITGDQLTYSLHLYNDKRINTAAMRYLRYINNENSSLYNFDTDAIGVYGNSKGGWFTFLGSEELLTPTAIQDGMTLEESIDARINSYTSKRDFVNHVGETYYQNGKTETKTEHGVTVDGGTLQPWLTYKTGSKAGEEISSYANLLAPHCAPAYEDIEDGHAPIFISCNVYDEYRSAYFSSNIRANLARVKNVPSIVLEAPVAHMLAYGTDLTHGTDVYDVMFDFFGYYLKGENVKVAYTTPKSGTCDVDEEETIVIKFIGTVSYEQITKVTVKDKSGNAVSGSWSALYGNTEWIFTPDAMNGNTEYTVTVPADLEGGNGTTLGSDYVFGFTTEYGKASEGELSGNYVTATLPTVTDNNGFALRFRVSNDAANIAKLYAVESLSDTEGEYLGSVNVAGAGYYEIDITDYAMSKTAGEELYFLIKADKVIGVSETKDDFVGAVASSGYTTGSDGKSRFAAYVRDPDTLYPICGDKFTAEDFDGESTVKFVMGTNGFTSENIDGYKPQYNEFYARLTAALFSDNLINGGKYMTEADYGRKFTVTMRLYDTTSRDVLFYIESMTGYYLGNYKFQTMDYDQSINNFNTVAGEWMTLTLEYTVREPDFGIASEYEGKRIMLEVSPEGYIDSDGNRVDYPIYVDYISVKETVTDISVSEASLVATHDGGKAYKSNSTSPVSLYRGETLVGSYETLNEALGAYTSGDVVRLGANITLTDSDVFLGFGSFAEVNIDLCGYKLIADTKERSLFTLAADSLEVPKTTLNVYGGSVYLGDSSLVSYLGSTSVGAGKHFEVNFEDVFFALHGKTAFANELFSTSTIPTGSELKSDITLKECTVRLDGDKLPRLIGCMFPKGEGSLDVSYYVDGGEIWLDSERWIDLNDALKALTFINDSGSYTTLRLPSSERADSSVAYMSTDGIASFSALNQSGNYNIYSLEVGELSTRYGMIPEAYADVDANPFIIFDAEGGFVASKTTLDTVLDAFKNTSGSEWFVVLRKSYTYETKFNNLGQGNGTITLDLGGNTVTLATDVMLYNADAKKNGDITVYTKNGTVEVSNLGMLRILGWDTSAYDITTVKNFDFHFEKVTVKLASGATTTNLATYNYERAAGASDAPAPANNHVTFTDCIFDIRGAAAPVTIFNVGAVNGGQNLVGTYVIKGGQIICDNPDNLNIYSIASTTNSSFTLVPNESGDYLTVTLPSGSDAPAGNFNTPEGYMFYALKEGSTTVFTLKKNSLDTAYGKIDELYSSTADYPFVVFDKDGNCRGGGKYFAYEVSELIAEVGDGAVALLRQNYDFSIHSTNATNQLAALNGRVTVDLGEYTVTMGSNKNPDAFIKCDAYASGYVTGITVTNGKIVTGGASLVRFSAASTRLPSAYDYNNSQSFDVVLDGVDIVLGSTIPSSGIIGNAYENVSAPMNASLTLKDCNIDLTSSETAVSLFATVSGSSNKIAPTYTVLGGNIKCNTPDSITYSGFENGLGSLAFGKGKDGEYTTLTSTVTPAAVALNDYHNPSVTDLRFVEYKEGAYVLRTLTTKYGVISENAASLLKYPFILFKKDTNSSTGYTYATASSVYTNGSSGASAIVGAKDLATEVVILMRRDYNIDSSTSECAIMGQATELITVDLGGYTLTSVAGSSKALIYASKKQTTDSNYAMINGTVVLNKSPLVKYYSSNAAGGSFNVTLENLTIVPTNETTNVIAGWATAPLKTFNLNITAKNCTVDMSGRTGSCNVFNAADSNGFAVIDIDVIGGKIKADAMTSVTLFTEGTNGSLVTFSKNDSGKYTEIELPEGVTLPTTTVNDGKLTYVKSKSENTYTLVPTASIGLNYVPKTSVSLHSDLIFNIYLPEQYLESATLNGNPVELGEAKDGYYKISTSLLAKEAAKELKLVVTLDVDGTSLTGTFTFSTVKYAKKIIEGEYTDVEKTLAKDMLAYVRSAYVYLAGATNETAEVVAIDAVLGSYEREVTKVDDVEINTAAGLKGATFNLKETPKVRFILPEGANPGAYTFKIGETTLSYTTGKVTMDSKEYDYCEIELYACELMDVITYTDGENSGSYHINSYYDYVVGTGEGSYAEADKATLSILTAKLYNYCQSAAAYRDAASQSN